MVPNFHYDSGHDVAQMDLSDRAGQLVSSGELHTYLSRESEDALSRNPGIVSAITLQFPPESRA
jgi:hypothetical protein